MTVSQKLRTAIDAQETGRTDDAERLYWDILRENPNDFVSLYHIGVISFNRGDYPAAEKAVRKSLAIHSYNPSAYNTLGLTLAALGKKDEAIATYRQGIALEPQNPDFYNNLAGVFLQQSNLQGVVEACQQAISYKPDFFLTYYNLGVALQRQGKAEAAVTAFKKAIGLLPAFPEAYCNMGLAFVALGKREEAVAAYRQAIAIRPNFPEAHNNLGQPLYELGRIDEAIEAYRQATLQMPTYTDSFINLAHVLRGKLCFSEAIEACIAGLAVNPNYAKAQIELGNLRRLVCDWRHADDDLRHLLANMVDAEPFLLLSVPSSKAEQLFCAQRWAMRTHKSMSFLHNRSEQPERIRIGYLSCDFHLHATAFLMAELFERHDRSRFEIFAYSYDAGDDSAIRQRIIKGVDHFIDFRSTPDQVAAHSIYKDKINILIDLKGYTHGARTGILADRPAPIQVNYVGYPGTMGADFIDYILADPVVAPMEHQPYYSEKIAQLPHCYQPNDTKREISSHMQTRSECGLPEKGFVFCCFNASFKISPSFFAVWMRLLKAVPGSALWLISTNETVEANLRREAKSKGIDPKRLVFARPIHLQHHLARHRLADLFLDALPYGAHTTASDALWAGLPVLTCMGETFAGRVGASLLHAVGLPELITTSLGEYEARALQLATHPEMLSAIKQKLNQNLPTAPLFDINLYTRGLEEAYTRMWDMWRSGKQPQPFAVGKP